MSRYRANLGIVAPRGLPDDAQSPRLRAEPVRGYSVPARTTRYAFAMRVRLFRPWTCPSPRRRG